MVSEHVLWKTSPGLLKVSLLVAKNIVISIVGLFCFFFLNWDLYQYESFAEQLGSRKHGD